MLIPFKNTQPHPDIYMEMTGVCKLLFLDNYEYLSKVLCQHATSGSFPPSTITSKSIGLSCTLIDDFTHAFETSHLQHTGSLR